MDTTPPPPLNPDNPGRGIWFMGLTWTLTILSLLTVGIRFWIRLAITLMIYIEDWIMLVACLLNLSAQALVTVSYHYGLGKHDEDLAFDQAVNTGKWIWMSYTPAILSSAMARISIMILLVRIFGPKRILKLLVIITTTLSVAAVVAQIVTVWNQMKPVEGLWNPLAGATLQFSPDVAMVEGNIIGALFAFGDLVYVLAPVLVVWKLNMPFHQKLGLCILLSLSILTMGISIAKSVNATSSAGSLYGNTIGLFFANVEQNFVIILGCAPPLSSVTKLKLPPAILSLTSMARKLVSGRRDTQYIIEDSDGRDQGSYVSYHELLEARNPTSSTQAGSTMNTKP
jgi:hypothetical protein